MRIRPAPGCAWCVQKRVTCGAEIQDQSLVTVPNMSLNNVSKCLHKKWGKGSLISAIWATPWAPMSKLLQIAPNREISSDFNLRYRALEIYVFDVRPSVGKEIVCTFWFFVSYRHPKYLHIRGTHQAHAWNFSFIQFHRFAWCVHRMCLMCAHTLGCAPS